MKNKKEITIESWKNYFARQICQYNFMEVTPENVNQIKKEFLNNVRLLAIHIYNFNIPQILKERRK